MPTQTLSIGEFERLPRSSSSHAQRISQAADDIYHMANLYSAAIFQFMDMQSLNSAEGLHNGWGSLTRNQTAT